MNDILSQIIAYAPNKIDTETKARAMVPGPRNMKLAEVPRSEMDNFNTPDLDQGADSILRPGETLEDFDVEFRRPNAEGGVQQLVQPNADGSRPGYKGKLTDEERAAAYAKRINAAKIAKEANFKKIVDNIFEKEDFANFKAEVTDAQKRFAEKQGKVRRGTGIIPAQYIKEFNQAMSAGVDSPEFKNLLKITGRTKEEILKLNELRPGGKVPIKVRAQATKDFPPVAPKTKEEKLTTQEKTKKKRAEASSVGKKYASEAELKRFNQVNKQKKKLNIFFKENPKALLNTEFGKKIKELMDVRIDNNGKFFQNTRPDNYYIAKAKEGKIFDIFDINKISKGQRSTKFTSNLNILPGQFNQAFIEGQVNKYFKKGGKLEGQTEILKNVSNYLDNIGVKVDIEDVGRIGGGNPVFFDSKTNRYPHIENTLNKMKIPNELLTDINPGSFNKNISAIQSKGIAKKLDAAGFKCKLSNGLTCNDPRAYTQSIKENMSKIQQGDDAAIAKLNKLGKGMNAFKGAAKFTGWGLLAELGIAAPLAAVDYAKGANKDEIISNATYGLFGKNQDEQLREKYPDYGQTKDFQKTYDKLLKQESALDDQTGYGSIINPQNIKNTEKKLMEQSKQFDSVLPPSQGLRSEFDLGKFLNMMVTDQQRDKLFADQKAQRAEEIGILKPSTGLESYDNFMEGGIASLNVKK